MKQLLGFIIGLLGLALAALLVLRIWDAPVISPATVLRSGATLAVVTGTLLALLVVRFTFFKNPAAGYNARVGNRAHPQQRAAAVTQSLPPTPAPTTGCTGCRSAAARGSS